MVVARFLSFPLRRISGGGGLSNGTPSPLRAIIPISPSARGALQSLSTRLNKARGAACCGEVVPSTRRGVSRTPRTNAPVDP